MGKYDPLNRFLSKAERDEYDMAFSEIEEILACPLPPSAHRYQAWWANESHGSHSHARSWQDAGWETARVNLPAKQVRFVRKRRRGGPDSVAPSAPTPKLGLALEDLIASAMALSGIKDRDEMIAEALRSFIQREAVQRLIAMGGTMPDFEAAPRERPFA